MANSALFLTLAVLSLFGSRACLGDRTKAALVIIDVQDCFVAGGSLAVTDANDIIPIINGIRDKYKDDISLVVLSQDWHLPGHVSFASAHPGIPSPMTLEYTPKGDLCTSNSSKITTANFPDAVSCTDRPDTVNLTQALWPDHCLQGVSSGPESSAFAKALHVEDDDVIIKKGVNLEVDSYSAFFDNGGFGKTRLDSVLKQRGITHVIVTGLAADYCVYYTSLDAHKLGYETYYVMDATRAVSKVTMDAAIKDLVKQGVNVITTDRLDLVFQMNSAPTITNAVSSILLVTSVLTSALTWKLFAVMS